MPISCPITFPRLSQEAFGRLDFAVMKHAMAAHRELGCLCDENIYQAQLAYLLTAADFDVQTEIPCTLQFRSFVKILYLDAVINGQAIYEFKTVAAITPPHRVQLLN